MNFDSVTCQDHKITKKTRLNRIKSTLKSQKNVLKKVAYGYATMPQRVNKLLTLYNSYLMLVYWPFYLFFYSFQWYSIFYSKWQLQHAWNGSWYHWYIKPAERVIGYLLIKWVVLKILSHFSTFFMFVILGDFDYLWPLKLSWERLQL